MSLAGGAGLAMEPEEPKVIRIGTDFQCTSIPTMPPSPGAAPAEPTLGAEELTAAGTTLWSPTTVEPARLSAYPDAAAQQLRPAEPGRGGGGAEAEGISRGEIVEARWSTSAATSTTWTRRRPSWSAQNPSHALPKPPPTAQASPQARSLADPPLLGAQPALVEASAGRRASLSAPMVKVFEAEIEEHGKDFRKLAFLMNAAARRGAAGLRERNPNPQPQPAGREGEAVTEESESAMAAERVAQIISEVEQAQRQPQAADTKRRWPWRSRRRRWRRTRRRRGRRR